MRTLLLLAIAWAMAGRAWATLEPPDPTPLRIAALPWDTSVSLNAPLERSQVEITVRYSNPAVVTDSEIYGIRVRPIQMKVDANGHIVMEERVMWGSKIRDFVDGSCSGGGTLTMADRNGFDYRLNLSWRIGKEKPGKLDETFHGLWVKEQTFKKEGFTITITVKVK